MPNLLSAVFAPAANYRMFLGDIISYSLQFSLSEGLGKNYSQCVLEWAPSLVVHHPLNCCEFFFFCPDLKARIEKHFKEILWFSSHS